MSIGLLDFPGALLHATYQRGGYSADWKNWPTAFSNNWI